MAAEKKWNLQSFSTDPNLFSNSSTYVVTCSGQNTFIDLNKGYFILSLNVAGLTGGATYSILKPTTSWITILQTTLEFITERGKEVKNYSGYVNRGVAANVLETLEYTTPKYNNMTALEYLSPVAGLTSTQFQAVIPLKWLCDAAYDAELLNLDSVIFTVSWDQVQNIFLPSAGTPTFTVSRVDFMYPTITVTDKSVIPRHIREIPNREIYIQNQEVPVGSTTVSTFVTTAFPVSAVYYFFVGASNYTLNPNPTSVVTQHQLASMGAVYPLIATYNAQYNPGVIEVGTARHYLELISIAGKDNPDLDNVLTYTDWRDNKRIYSIEIGTEQRRGQAFNFQCLLSTATAVASTCVMIYMGRSHI